MCGNCKQVLLTVSQQNCEVGHGETTMQPAVKHNEVHLGLGWIRNFGFFAIIIGDCSGVLKLLCWDFLTSDRKDRQRIKKKRAQMMFNFFIKQTFYKTMGTSKEVSHNQLSFSLTYN